jgi:hypothetical protein
MEPEQDLRNRENLDISDFLPEITINTIVTPQPTATAVSVGVPSPVTPIASVEPLHSFPQTHQDRTDNTTILNVEGPSQIVSTSEPLPRRSTRQRVEATLPLPRSVAIPTKPNIPVKRHWTYVPIDAHTETVSESSKTIVEHAAMLIAKKIADGRKQPPQSLSEARKSNKESAFWESAMLEELASLQEKGTGVLVPLPPGRKAVGSRWVYAYKYDENGQIVRYKAHLVAQGFLQVEGLNFTEAFAPVAKYDTTRAFLSMVAKFDLELDQMDVKTAFLNGGLDEDIYMCQPPGFEDSKYPDWVWKLLKAIYGLKQAGRQWNKTLNDYLWKEGFDFVRSEADYSLYVLRKGDKTIWLLIYVDDMLLASNCRSFLDGFKAALSKHFEMKDLGEAHHFLGMHITRDRPKRLLQINQTAFLEQIPNETKMSDCWPASTPLVPGVSLSKASSPLTNAEKQQFTHLPYAGTIGELNFAMHVSRPDIVLGTMPEGQIRKEGLGLSSCAVPLT